MNSAIDHFGEQAKTKPVDDTHATNVVKIFFSDLEDLYEYQTLVFLD